MCGRVPARAASITNCPDARIARRVRTARFTVIRTLLVWLGLCCLPPVEAFAQRALHWDKLDVVAHLNPDGTLTVTETQTMVFTGDWNGGERKFNIRPRQHLSLIGISRRVPDGWRRLNLDSSLDDVDDYAWTDGETLRWRSRLPGDPAFAATSIVYELQYVLSGILLKEEDRYRLDHDFAFPDREGPITRFELRLTLDPEWQPLSEVRPMYTAGPISPGRSFVLEVPLRYAGTGDPAALDLSRAPEIVAGVGALLGLTGLAVLWLFVREHRLGRFAAIARDVDESWVREHVLQYPAEVVGAAWDENVGTAEVVALIARMVSEGKLWSSVGKGKGKSASMTLRLEVDRSTLDGHERTLVDKLFFNGRTETSTAAVKAHYRTKGFNPATEIEKQLKAAVDSTLPGRPLRRINAIGMLLFLIGAGLLAYRWFQGYPVPAWLVLVMAAVAGIGRVVGMLFRRHLEWGPQAALWCLTPAAAIAVSVALYLWYYAGTGRIELDPLTVAGLVALALSSINSVVNSLKSRRSRESIAFRKRLTAGRTYFIAQLQQARPALRDEWYPWLLGMELGKQVDEWSTQRADTRTSSRHVSTGGFASTSSSASSSSDSPFTGFGGGRSGGAGAMASWQAAASGMAATVSPPSSSGSSGGSSGGGSSGGGSSGGGGGGGW